jgi:hypothetical protein
MKENRSEFDLLRHGLPQDHSSNLTFQHALDIDSTATRLASGPDFPLRFAA